MDPKKQAILDALEAEGLKYDQFQVATANLGMARQQLAKAQADAQDAVDTVEVTKSEAEAPRADLISVINDAFRTA
jgi:hypothetical protein